MRAAMVLLSLLILLIVPLPGHAVTYYVSTTGNDATSCDGLSGASNINNPRRTINKGIECMRNPGGDILYIRAGTYNGIVGPKFMSGTSDLNRNMIAGYPGETVIVTATGSSGVLSLGPPSATQMIKYLIFDNLIFDGTGGTGNVIGQEQSYGKPNMAFIGNNIFRNGEIRNGRNQGIGNGNHGDEIHHMKIHHNGLTVAVPPSHGIYMCAPDMRIHDNEIYHNGQYGIQFYTSSTPEKTNGCSSRTKIYNNKIYDNGALNATTFPGGNTAGAITMCCGDSNEIFNNLMYENGWATGSKGGGGISALGVGSGGPNTNYRVCNNTIVHNNGYGIQMLSGMPHVAIKNNIFYQHTTTIRDDSGNSLPLDSSNTTVNPNFTNQAGGDFTPLTGSPAIDNGTPNDLTFDFLGKPRPSGPKIDVGAIEVQQGPAPITPATYYVAQTGGSDTLNNCTAAKQPGTPKATITGAQGGLRCLSPGSTLLIKAGVYPEKIDTDDVPVPGGTDWAHATTIAAFGNDVVTLQIPITGSGSRVGIFFRDTTDSHYIVVDRINVDGLGQQFTNGFVCYPGTDHIRYQNGEIKNTYYEPVLLRDAPGCEVLNNSLHDWLNLSGVKLQGTASSSIVRGNTIFNGPGSGILADANVTGTAMSSVVLEQNTISNVGITSSLAAMVLGGTNNTNLIARNNLLYNSYRGIEVVTGSPSVKVLNNTVYGMNTTGIQANAGAITTNVRNNISYNNSGTAIADASGQMVQQTNLIINPIFVDAGAANFQLQSTSPAINTGTSLADVTVDLLGVTRPATPDIGAYEFTGTPSQGGITPRRGSNPSSRGFFEAQ